LLKKRRAVERAVLNRFNWKSRRSFLILLLGVTPVAHSATSQDSQPDPAVIFRQGVQAMQNGQLALAEGDFRRVIALDPLSGAAHVNLGVAYMREKRWDDALVELRKAQSLSPNESGISLNIGLAFYRKNDYAAAIEPFAASLRQAPQSLQARYLLGLCYFFTDRYQQASETLAPLWERESTNPNYLYVLTIAAGKSSNTALEKQALEQMLSSGQSAPEFHLYIGKAWLAKGDTEKAVEEFNAPAAPRPNLPLVHYFLGRAYLEQHAYNQAEGELLKEVARDPDFAYSYEDLGLLYAQLNQTDKAERAFRHAIERDQTLVNSYIGLGKLYRHAGRYREALDMLDHAVTLAPNSASVHYARAQVLARLGQSADAHQEFDTSSRLLKSFNDRLQQDPSGDLAADAQDAAQQ
jgi:tetratricopeptide (TPR) repeat protein